MSDWNTQVIDEFRANAGKVGGPFEGMPMVLVHHTGRRSATERVTPLVYLPGEGGTIYIFASKGGAPTHPDWYYNLAGAGTTTVEVGEETYPVTVTELAEPERTSVYDRQASAYPGFAEYAEKTAGIRVIPVLQLTRS